MDGSILWQKGAAVPGAESFVCSEVVREEAAQSKEGKVPEDRVERASASSEESIASVALAASREGGGSDTRRDVPGWVDRGNVT